jgi:hypothetical protein
MHEADAEFRGKRRRQRRNLAATHHDFPARRRMFAGENLHQRRLARAVFAEKHLHLARAHL